VTSALPVTVRAVCATYLALVDAVLPGFVEALYLHGSLVFGEWHGPSSDVDFMVVSSRRPTAAELRLLRQVHADLEQVFPAPRYDGCYVTWVDLAAGPDATPDVPGILAGDFGDEGRYALCPVTWCEIAWHGVTVRGPVPAEVDVWADLATLKRYSHQNMQDYWAPNVEELARFPDEAGNGDVVAWYVLGPPRLHHLLVTGRLTSKDGAGAHAVAAFGERWRPLVAEALAFRATGELVEALDHRTRGEQVLELARTVVRASAELTP